MSEEMLPSHFGWVKKNIKRFVLVAVAAIVFTACSEPTPIEQFPTLVLSSKPLFLLHEGAPVTTTWEVSNVKLGS